MRVPCPVRYRPVQVEDMAVTEAQARAVLPIYREHRHQAAQLASEAAESLATLQRLQQARRAPRAGMRRCRAACISLQMPLALRCARAPAARAPESPCTASLAPPPPSAAEPERAAAGQRAQRVVAGLPPPL